MSTKAFKPPLRNSETCGSGLTEESRTLQRYAQGRVEASRAPRNSHFPLPNPLISRVTSLLG
jgi:hypothetical protein